MTTKEIKAMVRARDGFKCVDCGATRSVGKRATLHTHRLTPGSEYTIDGCVTLCHDCHGKRHSNASTGTPDRVRSSPAVLVSLPISHELKEAIGAAADAAGMAMNEWIAELVAKHFGRPELAEIPRKPFGRPRKTHEEPPTPVPTRPWNGHGKAKVGA